MKWVEYGVYREESFGDWFKVINFEDRKIEFRKNVLNIYLFLRRDYYSINSFYF